MPEPVDEIIHYGVKGMKWGRRKATTSAPIQSSDAKRANKARAKAKSKGTQSLSNDELKLLNERIRLEKQYGDLTKASSTGRKATDKIINQVGGMAISAIAGKYLIKRIT